jgi:uncharacterized membrane protein YoaK (UPF0700 family)
MDRVGTVLGGVVEDAWRTLRPTARDRHGPLAPLLIALTLVTGLVDAFSYLALGHVFVANMTGNVVFLGFALAGAPGFSVSAPLLALVSFVFGAGAGGWLGSHLGSHRGHLVAVTASVEAALLVPCVALTAGASNPIAGGVRYALIGLLAGAMGVQNATARRVAVPDLTTTVLTLTITGISADSPLVRGPASRLGRRGLAVATMFLGALVGSVLVLQVDRTWTVAAALVVMAAVGLAGASTWRSEAAWVAPA